MRRIQANTCTIISEDTHLAASSVALATLSPDAAAVKTVVTFSVVLVMDHIIVAALRFPRMIGRTLHPCGQD